MWNPIRAIRKKRRLKNLKEEVLDRYEFHDKWVSSMKRGKERAEDGHERLAYIRAIKKHKRKRRYYSRYYGRLVKVEYGRGLTFS